MGKGSHEREDTLRPPTFEIMVAPLVQRLRLPTKGLKFWRFDNTISEFWAYFSLRMRRNAYLRASGQKSDPALRFGDPDFCNRGITLLSEYIFAMF